jgi:hypothetical protein
MSNELVKQNINFMENPLWMLSEHKLKELKIKNDRGEYILTAGYKAPERTDMNFLLFFLMESQKNGYVQKMEFTRYEILKACGMGVREREYDRLKDGLKRWINVVIEFNGTFYDNREYIDKTFNIINQFSIDKETKKLKIELNKSFLDEIKYSNFCKYIDFEEYKRLRKPVSNRLYEILSKTFVDRQEWEIESLKLAEKLTLGEGGNKKLYPADIKIMITPAVNEINQKTELKIELETRRNKNKELIFRFKLLKNLKVEKQKQENDEIQTLIDLLKEDYRENKGIKDVLNKYYSKHGYDYVKYNILYSNKKASKAYAGFLKEALKENWGAELKLEQEKIAKQEQLRQVKLEEERKTAEETRTREEHAWQINRDIANFVNNLEYKEKDRFINSVLDYLQGKPEFQIAVKVLNSNLQITPINVAMFIDAFNSCYNSYIHLNRLDFQLV